MNDPIRYALGIRYDGSRYHGWQSQGDLSTVQRQLEAALSRVANHSVKVVCAGRTDAGVHATAQVVHFDSHAKRSEYSWKFGANSNLPSDISVVWSRQVSSEFHARFSATGRRYRYVLFNHESRPGILKHAVGWHYRHLDEVLMQQAANYLLGTHDFSSFRGAGCQAKSPIRTLHQLDVKRQGRMILVETQANAFLLHMVRNITGVLMAVGEGRQSPEWAKEVLEACDRRQGGVTISPAGLYLVEVQYPSAFNIPANPIGPFFLD